MTAACHSERSEESQYKNEYEYKNELSIKVLSPRGLSKLKCILIEDILRS